MLYSIFAHDVADSLPLRVEARPAHIARLQALDEAGRLILAGPNPAIDSMEPGEKGFTGSLIVAEFDSLQQAQEWANQDPYMAAGVYSKVEVKPFKQVFPKSEI
ncbi:YciI family protein [Thiomicrorhabdus sp.]|uniref:YciI family protein n=1 Tax=Thiomicrorhabdus sp. TaxID=2039724 RepID=UPI0029C97DE5|nr:YciI family protein [Thiomicrorhabdus sp.]